MKRTEERIELKRAKAELTVDKRTITSNFAEHWHTFFEIELVLSGDGIHKLNGKESPIGRGTLFLIDPTDFHALTVTEPMTLYNISFSETAVNEKTLSKLSSPLREKQIRLSEDEVNKLSSLMEILKSEADMPALGCSRELLSCILTVIERHTASRSAEAEITLGVGRAIMYLNMHFRDSPTLLAVAKEAGFHPNYFSETFKRATGKSFSRYLCELKLAYARTMLDGGFSVTETCYRSGFGSLSNFLSTFKREVGCSPSEYRRKNKLPLHK